MNLALKLGSFPAAAKWAEAMGVTLEEFIRQSVIYQVRSLEDHRPDEVVAFVRDVLLDQRENRYQKNRQETPGSEACRVGSAFAGTNSLQHGKREQTARLTHPGCRFP
jgi:hypothetical protein